MPRAFVFPGQGSQAVGMGKTLAEAFASAREVFGEVDEALSFNLSRLMFEGPESQLTLTENAQPALMAVSLAVLRVLERDAGLRTGKALKFVAGHSLGEYSALAAVGTFTLADAARLLRRRGQAMQQAVPVGVGAMAALLGAEIAVARELAEAAAGREVCEVANDNAPGQIVLSGHASAVERAIELAKERKLKAIRLPVSAPFHCRLMAPAAVAMREALDDIVMRAPAVPVVCNVEARAASDPADLKSLLVRQVTGLVRWRESVLYMKAEGVDTLVEVGAGKVLSGMVKRIDRELTSLAVGTPADIEAYVKAG